MWCRWYQRDLTALADGELEAHHAQGVRSHLARCAACEQMYADLARSVVEQRRMLPLVIGRTDVGVDRALGAVRGRLEGEPVRARGWMWPAGLAAATAVGALLFVALTRTFDPVLIAFGVAAPPRVVAEKPELFRDYSLFEHLDVLENFDRIEGVPIGDSTAGRPRG